MNLLVLSTWFPYPPDNGSRLRAFHLLRELAKRGYRIRLLAGRQADVEAETTPDPLSELCEEIIAVPWHWHDGVRGGAFAAARGLRSPTPRSITETFDPAIRDAVADLLQHPTDAVLVLELGMDAYLPEDMTLTCVIDQVELSAAFQKGGNLRQRLAREKARGYWRYRLARYDAVTAVSESEAEMLRCLLGEKRVSVLPNGVDVAAYDPDERRPVLGRLLYSGSITYGPNREAVLWFVREVLPWIVAQVPEAHLVVTGRFDEDDPDTAWLLRQERVRLTGLLPDLRSALAEAALCVVPLLGGGGTRLKILEAWAAGLPVVSTPIGAAGLMGEDGRHLRIAPTSPETFAEAIVQLLAAPEEAATLARNARRLVEEQYDWSGIGAELSRLLQQAIETRNV